MGRKSLRVLHTSDFHMGVYGDKDRESLDDTIALIPKHEVDLLIIAGDLFDHNRVDEDLVRFVAGKLQDAPCPVFIVAGNHDCLTPGSVYDRFDLWQRCTNIKIFKGAEGETVHLPKLGVYLWGKSIDYDDRDVNPLEGMPNPQVNGNWNIAVAHGYFVGSNRPLFPSYHINETEIAGQNWDYVALGHVPRFKRLYHKPMTYYSGSPSFNRTAALVELSEENGTRVIQCKV
jgi:exonuclease SbcD